ncbi:hypothetical protein SMACR_12763 [Sordaria macrospora]|uniref:WGS project CABT00000000 data, contig 2.30 n=2 Tax=Sordaria macrospora TaxID=5147 RepID=F7W569_SORMK|nr:uncharacterized protein SMAC_12763 [Sordaria macrospora k-hell]KAA8630543.1 hypothetical protein SMACR_12763 [Sordaria macrospora]WPJ62510.1 hypothetical protein SMAC4_12763 [Sordaria macrospora]CCC12657.1 unnamed protein product [Sordaria macrospora k-hell]
MKTVTLFILLAASIVSVFAAPIPSPDLTQATRRDGLGTEFDTDLCLLKKRTGVIGEGIDNCDM